MLLSLLAPEPSSGCLLFSPSAAEELLALPKEHYASFILAADRLLRAQPWSVTFHRPKDTPAGPHDYYSEGPYWWPDPKDPQAPYVRRDGERNPNRFAANHDDLGHLGDAALHLAVAGWRYQQALYIWKLSDLLRVWFVNDATRMNPNLEFGQAVRNVDWGRGTGLIDTIPLIWIAAAIELGRQTPSWDKRLDEPLEAWFRDFLRWMRASPKGLDERKSGNNHAAFWGAQVAAYAHLIRDAEARKEVWDFYRSDLARQFQPNGAAPREEARTRSLDYSAYNLGAHALICHMAAQDGVSLWRHGVDRAAAYLAPFVLGKAEWKKPQITKFDASHTWFLGLAGMGLNRQDWVDAQEQILKPDNAWLRLLELLLKVWRPAA